MSCVIAVGEPVIILKTSYWPPGGI